MPKEIEKLNNLQAVFTVSYCIYNLESLPHAGDIRVLGSSPPSPHAAERSHMWLFGVF